MGEARQNYIHKMNEAHKIRAPKQKGTEFRCLLGVAASGRGTDKLSGQSSALGGLATAGATQQTQQANADQGQRSWLWHDGGLLCAARHRHQLHIVGQRITGTRAAVARVVGTDDPPTGVRSGVFVGRYSHIGSSWRPSISEIVLHRSPTISRREGTCGVVQNRWGTGFGVSHDRQVGIVVGIAQQDRAQINGRTEVQNDQVGAGNVIHRVLGSGTIFIAGNNAQTIACTVLRNLGSRKFGTRGRCRDRTGAGGIRLHRQADAA